MISHNTQMMKHIREIGVSSADTLMDRVKLNQDSPLKKHMQDQKKKLQIPTHMVIKMHSL